MASILERVRCLGLDRGLVALMVSIAVLVSPSLSVKAHEQSGGASGASDSAGPAASPLPISHFLDSQGNVVVPQGAVAVATGHITASGDLHNSGAVYFLPDSTFATTAGLTANNVFNNQGALLSSILPAGGLPGYFTPRSPVDLSLTAVQSIVNAGGTISSSGNLTVTANSIVNALPAGVTGPPPVMQAMNNLNLNAANIVNQGQLLASLGNINIATAQLTNSGIVQSLAGNVGIQNAVGNLLAINNASGTILAKNNLSASTLGTLVSESNQSLVKASLSVLGGALSASNVDLISPDGRITLEAERVEGSVHVSGGIANIGAENGDLRISGIELTGDPIIYAAGDLILGGGIGSPFDLVFLAGGSIKSDPNNPWMGISSGRAPLKMYAGVNFIVTGDENCSDCAGHYQVLPGSSPSGGDIYLPNVPMSGGSAYFEAHASASGYPNPVAGDLTTGDINTSGNPGGAVTARIDGTARGTNRVTYGGYDYRARTVTPSGPVSIKSSNGGVFYQSIDTSSRGAGMTAPVFIEAKGDIQVNVRTYGGGGYYTPQGFDGGAIDLISHCGRISGNLSASGGSGINRGGNGGPINLVGNSIDVVVWGLGGHATNFSGVAIAGGAIDFDAIAGSGSLVTASSRLLDPVECVGCVDQGGRMYIGELGLVGGSAFSSNGNAIAGHGGEAAFKSDGQFVVSSRWFSGGNATGYKTAIGGDTGQLTVFTKTDLTGISSQGLYKAGSAKALGPEGVAYAGRVRGEHLYSDGMIYTLGPYFRSGNAFGTLLAVASPDRGVFSAYATKGMYIWGSVVFEDGAVQSTKGDAGYLPSLTMVRQGQTGGFGGLTSGIVHLGSTMGGITIGGIQVMPYQITAAGKVTGVPGPQIYIRAARDIYSYASISPAGSSVSTTGIPAYSGMNVTAIAGNAGKIVIETPGRVTIDGGVIATGGTPGGNATYMQAGDAGELFVTAGGRVTIGWQLTLNGVDFRAGPSCMTCVGAAGGKAYLKSLTDDVILPNYLNLAGGGLWAVAGALVQGGPGGELSVATSRPTTPYFYASLNGGFASNDQGSTAGSPVVVKGGAGGIFRYVGPAVFAWYYNGVDVSGGWASSPTGVPFGGPGGMAEYILTALTVPIVQVGPSVLGEHYIAGGGSTGPGGAGGAGGKFIVQTLVLDPCNLPLVMPLTVRYVHGPGGYGQGPSPGADIFIQYPGDVIFTYPINITGGGYLTAGPSGTIVLDRMLPDAVACCACAATGPTAAPSAKYEAAAPATAIPISSATQGYPIALLNRYAPSVTNSPPATIAYTDTTRSPSAYAPILGGASIVAPADSSAPCDEHDMAPFYAKIDGARKIFATVELPVHALHSLASVDDTHTNVSILDENLRPVSYPMIAQAFERCGLSFRPPVGVGDGKGNSNASVWLEGGNAVIAPRHRAISVETPMGNVHIKPGSVALLISSGCGGASPAQTIGSRGRDHGRQSTAVYSLHDSRSNGVALEVGGQNLEVPPGKCLHVTDTKTSDFNEVSLMANIGHRNPTLINLGHGRIGFASEFSIPSCLMAVKTLKAMLTSRNSRIKALADEILKNAAILADLTGAAGPYKQGKIALPQPAQDDSRPKDRIVMLQ